MRSYDNQYCSALATLEQSLHLWYPRKALLDFRLCFKTLMLRSRDWESWAMEYQWRHLRMFFFGYDAWQFFSLSVEFSASLNRSTTRLKNKKEKRSMLPVIHKIWSCLPAETSKQFVLPSFCFWCSQLSPYVFRDRRWYCHSSRPWSTNVHCTHCEACD